MQRRVHFKFWVVPLCSFQHIATLHGSKFLKGFQDGCFESTSMLKSLAIPLLSGFCSETGGILGKHVWRKKNQKKKLLHDWCTEACDPGWADLVPAGVQRAHYYWRSESSFINCWWGTYPLCACSQWNQECLGGWFLSLLWLGGFWKHLLCRRLKVWHLLAVSLRRRND